MPRDVAGKPNIDVLVLDLGTWRTFDRAEGDIGELDRIIRAARCGGVNFVDTAPVYGRSELNLAQVLRGDSDFFLATRVWATDRQEAESTFREQLDVFGRASVDLMQVHNLNNWKENLCRLEEEKAAGRIGSIGVTYQFANAFAIGGRRRTSAR